MKRTASTLVFLLSFLTIQAQNELHWPEDTAQAQEKWALFTDAVKSQRYQEGLAPFQWLLEKTPDLHPALYINGEKLYKGLVQNTREPAQKKQYQQQSLALYDLRMQYFHREGEVMNRKAFAAYQYYRNRKEQYPELFQIFEAAAQAGLPHFSNATLVAYMDVIRLYQSAGGHLSDEAVLSRYDQITQALQRNPSADDPADIDQKQTVIDNLLVATVQLDCRLIEEKFGKPFLEQPADEEKAKRIVALGLAYACTESSVFLKAAQVVQHNTPSFGLAKLIAILSDAQRQPDMAERYYQQAAGLAREASQQATIGYALAVHYQREGQKQAARAAALKAVEADPSCKAAYKLIGDLYFSSAEACRGGESQTRDRAVYIAAYQMYQRADRTDLMAQARQQFPSIETIFQEGFKEGQTLTVGCWIQEDVTLQRRPEVP